MFSSSLLFSFLLFERDLLSPDRTKIWRISQTDAIRNTKGLATKVERRCYTEDTHENTWKLQCSHGFRDTFARFEETSFASFPVALFTLHFEKLGTHRPFFRFLFSFPQHTTAMGTRSRASNFFHSNEAEFNLLILHLPPSSPLYNYSILRIISRRIPFRGIILRFLWNILGIFQTGGALSCLSCKESLNVSFRFDRTSSCFWNT